MVLRVWSWANENYLLFVSNRETEMESTASTVYNIDCSLKRSREELKPIKDQLIEQMINTNRNSIPAGNNMVIKLVEKKTRKVVSAKTLLSIVLKELGEEALKTVKAAAEAGKGQPVIKYSLRITEAE